MSRPTYVYRLKVEYPEGIDWRNPPETWESEDFYVGDGSMESTQFFWPTSRLFLSWSGAHRRADLLRKYGATVLVERSERVTWGPE